MAKQIRAKSWTEKIRIVRESFQRSSKNKVFAARFYDNLFYLKPSIKEYFKDTDFKKQQELLLSGMSSMLGYLTEGEGKHRADFLEICKSHSHDRLNIHPHEYYYWSEAVILTVSRLDPMWYDDMEYYWREVMSAPLSFMISQYFK